MVSATVQMYRDKVPVEGLWEVIPWFGKNYLIVEEKGTTTLLVAVQVNRPSASINSVPHIPGIIMRDCQIVVATNQIANLRREVRPECKGITSLLKAVNDLPLATTEGLNFP